MEHATAESCRSYTSAGRAEEGEEEGEEEEEEEGEEEEEEEGDI